MKNNNLGNFELKIRNPKMLDYLTRYPGRDVRLGLMLSIELDVEVVQVGGGQAPPQRPDVFLGSCTDNTTELIRAGL